jgi:hypothetical protein
VRRELLDAYGGNPQAFRRAFNDMSPMLESRGITPSAFASQYPRQAGLMARIYSSEHADIDRKADPLLELAARAGASKDLFNP